MLAVLLTGWCFLWGFFYEVYVWEKGLLDAFISSWWNWLGVAFGVLAAAFCSYIDDLIDEEEEKE